MTRFRAPARRYVNNALKKISALGIQVWPGSINTRNIKAFAWQKDRSKRLRGVTHARHAPRGESAYWAKSVVRATNSRDAAVRVDLMRRAGS